MVILLLSLLRYIVFSYQYYLLLGFFGLDLYLTEAFMFIAMIYFIVALIPTVALTEIGIKGSAAVFLLSGYYGNEIGVIAASFSLWIVNLAIPSLAGAVLLYRVKIFRDKNAV